MVMTTPADLAREFGVSGMRIRTYLRQRYPAQAPGRGGTWALSPAQVDVVRVQFTGRRSVRSSVRRNDAVTGPALAGTYRAAWYWEGNVQAAVVRQLEAEEWRIVRTADAGTRERGDDIRAEREGVTLVVEVKGYPPRRYADPARAAETKRTNPTVQAKHWLAEAIFRSLRTLGQEPDVRVAIAVPDFPRYRVLLDDVADPLVRLGIEVIVVAAPEADPAPSK
jgi:hypothetical protein